MNPKKTAEKSASKILDRDETCRWMGISLEEVNEGSASLSLTIKEQHINGHGICHGGIIFTLADSAFAFACNSRNIASVAQHAAITFIEPAKLGDKLSACAEEISLVKRNGIYDVTVKNQNGRLIAEFRGCSRTVNGQIF
tara:strand:- start:73 stop:492 length:420 start_codon:yes stop_codon:yes gene_type:complete